MNKGNNDALAVLTAAPLAFAMMTVFTGSFLPAAGAAVLVYVLAAYLPFCRGCENLWILLMAAPATVPVNFGLLIRYPAWTRLLPGMGEGGPGWLRFMPGLLLILSGAELMLAGAAGRILWPGQGILFTGRPLEEGKEPD